MHASECLLFLFSGDIPMRELVYRVQPLPERMLHMVWDFGQLSEKTEASYISEMVQKDVSKIKNRITNKIYILTQQMTYMAYC